MSQKKIIDQLNIVKQCRGYGVPLSKCPQFLFLAMGLIIIGVILATYSYGGDVFEDPLAILFVVSIEAVILFVIGYSVIGGFEKVAQANQMKSDFVDLVTHQLRSPLTTLKWGFDDLKEDLGSTDEKVKELEGLEGNINKMTEMVNNLLMISKLEQDNFKLEKNKVLMNNLVEDVISNYLIDKENRIKFIKKVKNVPEILSDYSQIEIVIDNLISNAIKYTPKGGTVEINLFQQGKFINFEVQDSGIGIPKNEQKKVFAKFERASNVSKVEQTGSGLGLFLTKEIVKKLGGKIGFKSEEDKGSTFWFKLPIK